MRVQSSVIFSAPSTFSAALVAVVIGLGGCTLWMEGVPDDDDSAIDDDITPDDDDSTAGDDDDSSPPGDDDDITGDDDDSSGDDDTTPDDDDSTGDDDDTTGDDDDDSSPPGDDDDSSDDDDDSTEDPLDCWAEPFRGPGGDYSRTIDWASALTVATDWTSLAWVDTDEVILATTSLTDPQVPFVASNSWGNWCAATGPSQGTWYAPASPLLPAEVNNGLAVFLQPDGMLVEISMFDDCGSYRGGWVLPNGASPVKPDVCQTDGFSWWGGHGGSHLTALGGAIRLGELTGAGPIDHVLSVEVDHTHLFYGTSETDGYAGFRWPANSADGYAGGSGPGAYTGVIPALQMGSLLALPPAFSCAGLATVPAQKICGALKVHGALVVDDPWGTDEVAFPVQFGVREEVFSSFGIEMHNAVGLYANDIEAMFASMVVVDNPVTAWQPPP